MGRLDQVGTRLDGRPVRGDGRVPGVHHRLVAHGRGAQLLDTGEGGLQGHAELYRRDVRAVVQGLGGLPETGAVQRSRGTAEVGEERVAGGIEHRLGSGRGGVVQRADGRLETPPHVATVVGVADDRVEVGQVVDVVVQQLGGLADPAAEHGRVDRAGSMRRRPWQRGRGSPDRLRAAVRVGLPVRLAGRPRQLALRRGVLDPAQERVRGGGEQSGGEGGGEVDRCLVPGQSVAGAEDGPGDHGAEVAGGVERGAGDRPGHGDHGEDHGGDGQAVPAGGGAAVGGGAEHDQDEQEGADQFGAERGAGVAGVVGQHAQAGVEAGLFEDGPDREGAGDGAGELGGEVAGDVGPGGFAGGGQGEGDGGVDVAAGDVADGVDHRDDHHHERQGDHAELGHGERDSGGAGDDGGGRGGTRSAHHQRRRTHELGDDLPRERRFSLGCHGSVGRLQ